MRSERKVCKKWQCGSWLQTGTQIPTKIFFYNILNSRGANPDPFAHARGIISYK